MDTKDSIYKISDRERTVLRSVELRAHLPTSQVAEELGIKEHLVRYDLSRLAQERVISPPVPFINLYALGYTEYALYFSLEVKTLDQRDTFLRSLIATRRVPWLSSIGGEYQYMASIYARDPGELFNLMKRLSEEGGNCISQKEILVRHSRTFLGRKYLNDQVEGGKPVFQRALIEQAIVSDQIDRRILQAISTGLSQSQRRLAADSGIPLSSFIRRRAKLEEDGIIEGYIYRVSAPRYGMELVKLAISTRGLDVEQRRKMIAFAFNHPYIVFVVECFGGWDYEFGIEVTSSLHSAQIAEEIRIAFHSHITGVSIIPLYKYLFYDPYPFRVLEDEEWRWRKIDAA